MSNSSSSPKVPDFTVDPEQEPEFFYKLINVESYPNFLPFARKMADYYLSQANYDASPLYAKFNYTETSFEQRMQAIYDDFASGMYDDDWRDSGLLQFRFKDSEELRTYPVGRMSDRTVIEGIKQGAPFNLVDGAWLNNVLTVGPSDIVQSHLFAIWDDEAGNGVVSQNHANVYEALLHSVNIYLPSITSSEFAHADFLPGAFTGAVFELSVGRFPKEYFPELLGMMLFLEWQATPTLQAAVRLLRGRGIDPHFYRLHVAIDNITAGHGFLAKEAIKLYLARIHDEGGDAAVQAHWTRVWNGYVTWATLGGLGNERVERFLVLDKKTINISTDPKVKKCWPDIKGYYRSKMIKLVDSKAAIAAPVHKGRSLDGRPLDQLFANPGLLLDHLEHAKYVNPEYPRDSKFLSLLEFDGPMYKIFTEEEKNVILDWIESLRDHEADCVDPLPDQPQPGTAAAKMAALIASMANRAKGAHDGINLTDRSGHVMPLAQFFDNPPELMAALVNCGWIVPGKPGRSFFLSRIATNGGPMDGVFSAPEIEIITAWIADGAKLPDGPKVMSLTKGGAPKLSDIFHLIGAGALH